MNVSLGQVEKARSSVVIKMGVTRTSLSHDTENPSAQESFRRF